MRGMHAVFQPGRALRAALVLSMVALLGLIAQPGQPAEALDTVNIYLPAVHRHPIPVGPLAIANPSFEENIDNGCVYNGFTDPNGNQHPAGWLFHSPAVGEVLPYTRIENGIPTTVYSDGPGEYIHKPGCLLPPGEQLGEVRALILDGTTVYKAFGFGIQQSLTLSQTVSGTPGYYARVVAYILNEEVKEGEVGCCAHDNSVVSVKLGDVEDQRLYGDMKNRFDISGNERAWNRFEVIAKFPDSGELLLEITMQQSWQTRTDFFIDNISGEILRDP